MNVQQSKSKKALRSFVMFTLTSFLVACGGGGGGGGGGGNTAQSSKAVSSAVVSSIEASSSSVASSVTISSSVASSIGVSSAVASSSSTASSVAASSSVASSVVASSSSSAPRERSLIFVTKRDGITITPQGWIESFTGAKETVTFTVAAGYEQPKLYGCGGTQSGNTYTTAPLSGEYCTISGTAILTSDAYALHNFSVTPNALFDDEFATAEVIVKAHATGTGFTLFAKHWKNGYVENSGGLGFTEVQLYDDGTHGDEVANDGWHTRAFAMGITPPLRFHNRTVDSVAIDIVAYDSNRNVVNSTKGSLQGMNLGIISRIYQVQAVPVHGDTSIRATANMVNIVIDDVDQINDPSGLTWKELTRKVYTMYPDVFDAIAIHTFGTVVGDGIPSHQGVKNEVTGTGQTIYNNTDIYGSAGKLGSVIDMANETVGIGFLHELGHRHAFFLNDSRLNLAGVDGAHTKSPISFEGQMNGVHLLTEQGNGDFLVVQPQYRYYTNQYADLELYLNGDLEASAVQPIYYVPNTPDGKLYGGHTVPRAEVVKVTIEDIIAVYGARTPSTQNTSKNMRVLWIGLSDHPMTSAEVSILNRAAEYYASDAPGQEVDNTGHPMRSIPSYKAATKGLGTLEVAVPAPLAD